MSDVEENLIRDSLTTQSSGVEPEANRAAERVFNLSPLPAQQTN
jgi:hypothetical protein